MPQGNNSSSAEAAPEKKCPPFVPTHAFNEAEAPHASLIPRTIAMLRAP